MLEYERKSILLQQHELEEILYRRLFCVASVTVHIVSGPTATAFVDSADGRGRLGDYAVIRCRWTDFDDMGAVLWSGRVLLALEKNAPEPSAVVIAEDFTRRNLDYEVIIGDASVTHC